jgi:hypothetical protein
MFDLLSTLLLYLMVNKNVSERYKHFGRRRRQNVVSFYLPINLEVHGPTSFSEPVEHC